MHVGAHRSPLTWIKDLLAQCNNFDGPSVPLPKDCEEEKLYDGCLMWQNASVGRCFGKSGRRGGG